MKIRYQINAYDYIAFQMYHAMHKPFYKRMMLLTRIIPSVFLLLIPIFLSLFTQTEFWSSMLCYTLLALLWYFGYPPAAKWMLKQKLKKIIQREKMFEEAKVYILSFTNDGIHETHNDSHTKVPWEKIHHVAETDKHIFIYFNPFSAIIDPKKALKTKEDQSAFREKILNKKEKK